ncbi:hypothetical protein Q5M85_17745 [Paraclostridium bifermentans]|nr:hypothetical protein [Paraclostridium bifermentans]
MKISNFTFKGKKILTYMYINMEPIEKENINGIVQIYMECQKKLVDIKDLQII